MIRKSGKRFSEKIMLKGYEIATRVGASQVYCDGIEALRYIEDEE